ncbi:MAG: CDP-diacylglycerol--glycerol-3-phosphate 3-phosphatidyltransferase [Pseudomonadota bacterium]
MRSLPNLLTGFRLLAAPGIAWVHLALPRPDADLAALILFAAAAVTDWLDGKLARALNAESAFGRMMDPIADKAMVAVALLLIVVQTGLSAVSLIPAVVILCRETAVSGLREFLAGRVAVPVTRLAKWKTGVQMTALGALLAWAWAEQRAALLFHQMGPADYMRTVAGELPDARGVALAHWGAQALPWIGFALLWIAAVLTAITGWSYFRAAFARGAETGKET